MDDLHGTKLGYHFPAGNLFITRLQAEADGGTSRDEDHFALQHNVLRFRHAPELERNSITAAVLFCSDAGACYNGRKLINRGEFMKTTSLLCGVLGFCFGLCQTVSATDYYVSLNGGHVPPFTNWAEAATNIQAAIDAASAGDTVWVTNGVFATGGKVMYGSLTNRVALDKALTLVSVNGPLATTIQGAWDSVSTNGSGAARCVWMTNGATLNGFTLTMGATAIGGSSPSELACGGGVWASSTNAVVLNSIIVSNFSYLNGGGIYNVSAIACLIVDNTSYFASAGGGSALSRLINCTVVGNRAPGAGGTVASTCYNTIVYGNTSTGGSASNFYQGTFQFSCTLPKPSGIGNIGADPQLLPDRYHLSNSSLCRGAGTNSFLIGTADIDGQSWSNPPSMGCDEWSPAPQPVIGAYGGTADARQIRMTSVVAGDPIVAYFWMRDGQVLTNDDMFGEVSSGALLLKNFDVGHSGNYQMVASNSWGVVTSAVKRLQIHCADANASNPLPPFTNWASAANTIQDAVDAALATKGVVLVRDGIYSTGGKVWSGTPTNRVAITGPLLVTSMNGPKSTFIEGAYHPVTTNGTAAVRCAWLADGAVLNGFTLRRGATHYGSSTSDAAKGAGVWCASASATVINCVIEECRAVYAGGGTYQGTIVNCSIVDNWSNNDGGGSSTSILKNSLVARNRASNFGGGVFGGSATSCTIHDNETLRDGGGTSFAALTNCIIHANIAPTGGFQLRTNNVYSGSATFCCSSPLLNGPGNIAADPQFLEDRVHLKPTSPCIAAGTNSVTSGFDCDGQAWTSTPSIGCDQWLPMPATALLRGPTPGTRNGQLAIATVLLAGQGPFDLQWRKGESNLTDGPHYTSAQGTQPLINGLGSSDAGIYTVIASNAFGVYTSAPISLVIHCVDSSNETPSAPFLNWSTAANTIQAALETASDGAVVLVTNGIYSAGGKVVVSDLTNRVAITKPIAVMSVNGPEFTVIDGAWDPLATNGPLAVRGAWLGKGAVLAGFKIQGGATRATDDDLSLCSGGGVLCESADSLVVNCIISSNAAPYGGGAFGGTLRSSRFIGNRADYYGGGALSGVCISSLFTGNRAGSYGGGAYDCSLLNCTFTANSAAAGGGISFCTPTNCIIYYNGGTSPPYLNYHGLLPSRPYVNNCTTPLYAIGWGSGNIESEPQLTDTCHLAVTSPCRGAGTNIATGTDLDGEPWANPPSMGCDEVWETGITGALAVAISAPWPAVAERGSLPLTGLVEGRATRVGWDFGDGSILTNQSLLNTSHVWTNAGIHNVSFTAFNTDFPNAISTNLQIQVLPLVAPTILPPVSDATSFSLSFQGQPGVSYWVDQATNLVPPVEWKAWRGLYSTGQVMQVIDSAATNDMQFYRIRVP